MSDNNEPTDSDGIRSLRAAAERGTAAVAELENVRRENLFLKAGIAYDKGPGKLLFGASAATTVDELLAEANEYGITPGSTAPPTLIVADDRGAVRQALADLPAAGAVEPQTADPVSDALENFWNDRKRGVPQDRALGRLPHTPTSWGRHRPARGGGIQRRSACALQPGRVESEARKWWLNGHCATNRDAPSTTHADFEARVCGFPPAHR
jgi:hypothetical protein